MPYATEESLSRILDGIAAPKNRKTVQAYLGELRANGCKLSTLLSQANHLRHWAAFMDGRPFMEATKEDVRDFINVREVERTWTIAGRAPDAKPVVRRVKLGNSTLNIRKAILKSFQRWLRGGGKRDPYPVEVIWLEQKRSASDESLPVEQIITPDELRLMIEAAPDIQSKALLHVLYDSGARASEFCSLRIKDVVADDFGAILALSKDATNLKTGARRIRIITSSSDLRKWLNAHPHKKDKTAPLWLAMSHRNGERDPMRASGLGYVVAGAARRAKLDKEVFPHLFRHSRATLAAKEGWPESVMRAHFGWSKSSDMPARYVHLAGKDADDYILQAAGVKPQDRTRTMAAVAPKSCPAGHLNSATNEYCEEPGCGRPLTPQAVEQTQMDQLATLGTVIQKEVARILAAQGLGKAKRG